MRARERAAGAGVFATRHAWGGRAPGVGVQARRGRGRRGEVGAFAAARTRSVPAAVAVSAVAVAAAAAAGAMLPVTHAQARIAAAPGASYAGASSGGRGASGGGGGVRYTYREYRFLPPYLRRVIKVRVWPRARAAAARGALRTLARAPRDGRILLALAGRPSPAPALTPRRDVRPQRARAPCARARMPTPRPRLRVCLHPPTTSGTKWTLSIRCGRWSTCASRRRRCTSRRPSANRPKTSGRATTRRSW